MATTFKAPYGAPELLCVMPNPRDEDNEGCEASIQTHTSITNITRVYRRVSGFRHITYTFTMTHEKANELKQFIKSYSGYWWGILDYRNRNWKVILTSNPVEFIENRRYRTAVTLEFLGVLL